MELTKEEIEELKKAKERLLKEKQTVKK